MSKRNTYTHTYTYSPYQHAYVDKFIYNIFTLPSTAIRCRGVVPRWSRIEYSGSDEYGGAIHRTVDGFHARVVQHECDHLLGVLYPMRIKDFTKFGFTEVLFPEIAAAEEDDD